MLQIVTLRDNYRYQIAHFFIIGSTENVMWCNNCVLLNIYAKIADNIYSLYRWLSRSGRTTWLPAAFVRRRHPGIRLAQTICCRRLPGAPVCVCRRRRRVDVGQPSAVGTLARLTCSGVQQLIVVISCPRQLLESGPTSSTRRSQS